MKIWVQYNIYTMHNEDLDLVLTDFVIPFLKENEVIDFFFIRYIDYFGPHIRLRFFINTSQIDQLHQTINIFYRKEKQKFDISLFLRSSLYSKENWKYNNCSDIVLVEKYFVTNSKNAISLITSKPTMNEKKIFSLFYSIFLLNEFLNPEEVLDFLKKSFSYWIPDLNTQKNLFVKSEKSKMHIVKQIESVSKINNYKYYVTEDVKLLKEAIGSNKKDTTDFLFHIIHMFNNRLGISPIEEAYLSIIIYNIKGGNLFDRN